MLKYFLENNLHDMVFIRNSFRRFIFIAYFLLAINFAITGMLFYNLFTIDPSSYFATTTDGRIINVVAE